MARRLITKLFFRPNIQWVNADAWRTADHSLPNWD